MYIQRVYKFLKKYKQMEKKLLTLSLVGLCAFVNAQLTYVGNDAIVHIQDEALVYSGGGVKLVGTAKVNTIGDFMVVTTSGKFEVASTADFRLKYSSPSVYGQLYLEGVPQGDGVTTGIIGKVNKEYVEPIHGITGRQQVALPFYNYSIADLQSTLPFLNLTNSGLDTNGRWNKTSAFKWNNSSSAFDQLTTSLSAVGKATDYYILPRRLNTSALTYAWDTTITVENPTADLDGTPDAAGTINSMKKIFSGVPVSDQNVADTQVTLSGAFTGQYGANGKAVNAYNERYNSYLDDPFVTPKWSTDYGRNVYQYGNPYLTNLDLSKINLNESNGDDVYIPNIKGFFMYEAGILNSLAGTTYNNGGGTTGRAVTFDSSDLPVGAVLSDLMVKPMQEFIIKLFNNNPANINFNNLRRFSQTPRTAATYSLTAARLANSQAKVSASTTKQLMVVLTDVNGIILDKTFYVVNEDAKTGFSPEFATMQATTSSSSLFTREELSTGGADASATYNLYINEANEKDFAGKEISLVVNNANATKIKFFLIESGELLNEKAPLSNGKSFYFSNNGILTKINSGDEIQLSNNNFTYGLFYEQPAGVLGTSELLKGQTIVAKKDQGYIVRFNKNWKQADIEVYTSAGQLLHSAKKVSTYDDYKLPLDNVTNGVYIVKIKSNDGEIVTKKVIK